MESATKPRLDLAKQILPALLLQSLTHVFAQGIQGCALSGGTALAGFYAGHRRSDDLDFFTRDDPSQKSTVLAVESLSSLGIVFYHPYKTHQYFQCACQFSGHRFTVTVVKDENLFRVGKAIQLPNRICVVDLETLLKMKSATLVSRCCEKDIYDLIWLLGRFPEIKIPNLIGLGNEIDAGVTGEAMLLSVSGAILREDACGFSTDPHMTYQQIYKRILEFQRKLILELSEHLRAEPAPSLRKLVKKLTKWSRTPSTPKRPPA